MLSVLKPDCIHCLEHHYFLFYEFGEHSFHIPMADFDSDLPYEYYENYAEEHGLKIVPIWFLYTKGEKRRELISPRFVNKVIKLIKTGSYTLEV